MSIHLSDQEIIERDAVGALLTAARRAGGENLVTVLSEIYMNSVFQFVGGGLSDTVRAKIKGGDGEIAKIIQDSYKVEIPKEKCQFGITSAASEGVAVLIAKFREGVLVLNGATYDKLKEGNAVLVGFNPLIEAKIPAPSVVGFYQSGLFFGDINSLSFHAGRMDGYMDRMKGKVYSKPSNI